MPKLHVHTAFTLRHDNGETESFGVGEHNFPAPVAAHWYVKHHTRESGAVEAKSSAAKDNGASKDLAEREAALKDTAELLNGAKAELDARSAHLDQRSADLDARDAELLEREKAHEASVAEFEAAQAAAASAAAAATRQGSAANQQRHQGGKR
jgi:peptidoglycan hydrolase CwlO-like protein